MPTANDDRKEREYLIAAPYPAIEEVEETLPSTSLTIPSSIDRRRLVSLDVFRGLTIALMILVDDAGGAFPSINHSPWFGVTLADFVMPFFLFGVGFSLSLVLKNVSNKSIATKKVVLRTIKLFLLGLLFQGGYFHGRGIMTYGVDLRRIRLMGVLQRISIAYLIASLSEIWLLNNVVAHSRMKFVRRYYFQWILLLSLCFSYMCLLYGLYVPDWFFEIPTSISGPQIVKCGKRGSLQPPCNAVGLIDRLILGIEHLYQRPVYRRRKECSVNSPDYGPLPPDFPSWCLAPFEPEGILSSFMAAVTCLLGSHFGHIYLLDKSEKNKMLVWFATSVSLITLGCILEFSGMPSCKALYTVSYTCVTGGAGGILFVVMYYMVEVERIRKPTAMLQYMGMNALLIYAVAACDLFPVALQGFYFMSPEANAVDGVETALQYVLNSKKWGTLSFVVVEIAFWGIVALLLHRRGIFVKL